MGDFIHKPHSNTETCQCRSRDQCSDVDSETLCPGGYLVDSESNELARYLFKPKTCVPCGIKHFPGPDDNKHLKTILNDMIVNATSELYGFNTEFSVYSNKKQTNNTVEIKILRETIPDSEDYESWSDEKDSGFAFSMTINKGVIFTFELNYYKKEILGENNVYDDIILGLHYYINDDFSIQSETNIVVSNIAFGSADPNCSDKFEETTSDMNSENPLDVCRSSIWAMDHDSCLDPVRKLNRTSFVAQESGKMFCDCNCCVRTDRCIWKERFTVRAKNEKLRKNYFF